MIILDEYDGEILSKERITLTFIHLQKHDFIFLRINGNKR